MNLSNLHGPKKKNQHDSCETVDYQRQRRFARNGFGLGRDFVMGKEKGKEERGGRGGLTGSCKVCVCRGV